MGDVEQARARTRSTTADRVDNAGTPGTEHRGTGEQGVDVRGDENRGAGERAAGEQGAGEQGAGEQGAGERAGSERTPNVPGVRATKQRAAVAKLLDQLDDFRSAQDIHEELRKRGEGIGLTTVYRTLQSLADAGEVDVLRTQAGEAIYRHCSRHHHHHLVCRSCGRTVEVEGPTVENWATRVAAENGFSEVSHTVEIFGTCSDCTR